jgi:hypothetical protein
MIALQEVKPQPSPEAEIDRMQNPVINAEFLLNLLSLCLLLLLPTGRPLETNQNISGLPGPAALWGTYLCHGNPPQKALHQERDTVQELWELWIRGSGGHHAAEPADR